MVAENRSGMALNLESQRGRAEALLARLGYDTGELGLAFTAPDEMERLNREYLGRTGPTDVLTFPLDAGEGDGGGGKAPAGGAAEYSPPLLLGDIVICPQVAERQADGAGHSLDAELCLLLVHGMLHLAGYDHETDTGTMDARQAELVKEFCRQN